jgi:hypothetical protein
VAPEITVCSGALWLAIHSAREPSRLHVDLVAVRFKGVVGLRDLLCVEGVRFDDVRAGFQVLAVDAADDVRPRQHQHVAVALQVMRMRRKPRAAEVLLLQLVPLDHRPHRAVQDQDALCE